MAIDDSVPMFLENAGTVYNAREFRRFFESMMGYDVATSPGTAAGGVFRPGHLAVTQNGTPNMTVNVAAGACYVDGSESGTQGGYFVYNDASVSVTIDPADGSNPRKDIIGVRIRDQEYSGGSNDAVLVAVKGTAAASPAEPTLPSNFLSLALVDIPTGDTAIETAQITDRRRRMSALGGITVCTSSTRPTTNPWEGQTIYETDTDTLQVYSGSGWMQIGPLGAWTAYTPTWTIAGTAVTVGNGSIAGAWQRVGRGVSFRILITMGSTTSYGGATGNHRFGLPTAMRAAGDHVPGSFSRYDGAPPLDSGDIYWLIASAGGAGVVSAISISGGTPTYVSHSTLTALNGRRVAIAGGPYEAAA